MCFVSKYRESALLLYNVCIILSCLYIHQVIFFFGFICSIPTKMWNTVVFGLFLSDFLYCAAVSLSIDGKNQVRKLKIPYLLISRIEHSCLNQQGFCNKRVINERAHGIHSNVILVRLIELLVLVEFAVGSAEE